MGCWGRKGYSSIAYISNSIWFIFIWEMSIVLDSMGGWKSINSNPWETSEEDVQSFANTISNWWGKKIHDFHGISYLHLPLTLTLPDAETQINKSPSSSPMALTSTQSMGPSRRFSWSSKRSSSSTEKKHPEMMDNVNVFVDKKDI